MANVARRLDVAVAVATRDRPQGLARCLLGILSGESLPRELVVVDQGKTDASGVVSSFDAPAGVALRHVGQARIGLSASRNEAVRLTTAPILAFTDDDCVPEARWLTEIDRAYRESPELGTVTGPVLPLGPPTAGTYPVASREGSRRVAFFGYVPPWQPGTGANMAVRRDWLSRVGGYDERLGVGSRGGGAEDIDLVFRLLQAGAHIRYEPGALVRHERQPAHRRRATRRTYGRGIGALCGLLLREGDALALRVLLDWARLRLRRAAGGARRGRWQLVREEWHVLVGTLGGLGYGVSAGRLPRRLAPPTMQEHHRDLLAEGSS